MRRLLLAAVVVVLLVAAWGLTRLGGAGMVDPLEVEPGTEAPLVPGDTSLPEPTRSEAIEEGVGGLDAGRREAEPVEGPGDGAGSVASETAVVGFVGRLVDPNDGALEVVATSATLSDEDGEVVARARCEPGRLDFPAVPSGRYTLAVTCADYSHRPEALEFAPLEPGARMTRLQGGSLEEDVTLWPDGWLPVVIETPDGEPFRTLAEDLGWEPKRLFVHAFEVRVSRELALAGQLPNETDPELATWQIFDSNFQPLLSVGDHGTRFIHNTLL